jgi:hypothetical protein
MERASLDASDILKEHQPLNLFYFIFVVKALGVKMLIKKIIFHLFLSKKKGKAQGVKTVQRKMQPIPTLLLRPGWRMTA